MPSNPQLRQRISALVREVLNEMSQTTVNTDPEFGTVTAVNDDGTVEVQTTAGATYSGVGASIIMTVGTQVVVITADGTKVAIPRGLQTTF